MYDMCSETTNFSHASINYLEDRNSRITRNVSIICICFMVCTFPHNIYGYMEYDNRPIAVTFYNVTLGLQWAQYCFNIFIHVAQKDQIWNAHQLYIHDKIVPCLKINRSSVKRTRKDPENAQNITI